jgi:chemotaxis protein methyltransferase CheR
MISITDKEFKELARYIKENYGINLKPEKQSLVNTRLNSVLAQKNFESFTDYYQ